MYVDEAIKKALPEPARNDVLVIDDDRDIVDALAEVLDSEGYRVRTAANGQEALLAIATCEPALILCDLMMPVMDGPEFVQRLKVLHPEKSMPIIIASANPKVAQISRELGVQGSISKPFSVDQLLATVRMHVAPQAAQP